jgi:hypothetical protein
MRLGDVTADLISLLAVVLLVLFNRWVAEAAVGAQNRLWGQHYGEKEVFSTRVVLVALGTLYVVWTVGAIIQNLMCGRGL